MVTPLLTLCQTPAIPPTAEQSMFNLTSHCLAPPLEVYGAPLGGRAPQFKNH